MRIALRMDASTRIGTGHVMRCIALAAALREQGAESLFVHRMHPGHRAAHIRAAGFAVAELPAPPAAEVAVADGDYAAWLGVPAPKDATQTGLALRSFRPDWLVVDHYALDAAWERMLRAQVGAIFVIDDLANRAHECDLLLDQNLGRAATDYAGLVPTGCEIWAGAVHALLRPVFAGARLRTLRRRSAAATAAVPLQRVLVAMGGGDIGNATETALDGLQRAGFAGAIDVVVGSEAPTLPTLRARLARWPGATLHVETGAMADLMANADLCIGAGGSMSWERCCLGLPAVALTLAENQAAIVDSLTRAGAALDAGAPGPQAAAAIASSIEILQADPRRLHAMSLAASAICDGSGASRLAERMLRRRVAGGRRAKRRCRDMTRTDATAVLSVGDRLIGPGHPPFVVAELGINHNGDMGLACESIAAAAEAGADSIKLQNYRTEDFVSDRSLMFEYRSRGQAVVEPQYDMFKRCELSRDQLALLVEEARRHGLDCHSTPTSVAGLADLQAAGCHIVKNGSDYLTHLDLIRAMGQSGLITVLSTGMATLAEIDDAVRTVRATGNQKLILLHCTSSYPTAPSDVNLARLQTLATQFGVAVGLSDHSIGTTAAVGATVLGACWIEKHFTMDHDLPGPDHWFSLNPQELRTLVAAVRDAAQMVGSARIAPTASEAHGRRDYRLSCVAAEDLPAGQRLGSEDIAFRRPGTGSPPSERELLVGRVLARAVKRGHVFAAEDFQ
jgi:N-acetylneuraminate synthase/N,N'-diacetyllegionaminate synthase